MLHYVPPTKAVDRERPGFSAIDIGLPSSAANLAEICLTGRYPETGFAMNTQSEMFVRVLEGQVTLSCEGYEATMKAGSTVLVETNRPYFWMPDGFVRLLVFSTPPWTPEQHRNVPK